MSYAWKRKEYVIRKMYFTLLKIFLREVICRTVHNFLSLVQEHEPLKVSLVFFFTNEN